MKDKNEMLRMFHKYIARTTKGVMLIKQEKLQNSVLCEEGTGGVVSHHYYYNNSFKWNNNSKAGEGRIK